MVLGLGNAAREPLARTLNAEKYAVGGTTMNVRPMLRFVCSLFATVCLLLAFSTASFAQTAETGALTGTKLLDFSGGVIAGAAVTITSTATGQTRTTTTDANGSYKFSLLTPGTYSVKFSAAGFKTAKVPSVTGERHGDSRA